MEEILEPLFKSDSDWHNNACLNIFHDSTGGYIRGYKEAADSLVIQVNDTARSQDILVYPIVFLYRHHLELLLKLIIELGNEFFEQNAGHPMHHRIKDLWPEAKAIIRKTWDQGDPEEFKLIDHVISELSENDPASMSFRYPVDKKGNRSVSNVKYINLRHLGQTIEKVSKFLDGVSMGIEHKLDMKYESLQY